MRVGNRPRHVSEAVQDLPGENNDDAFYEERMGTPRVNDDEDEMSFGLEEDDMGILNKKRNTRTPRMGIEDDNSSNYSASSQESLKRSPSMTRKLNHDIMM